LALSDHYAVFLDHYIFQQQLVLPLLLPLLKGIWTDGSSSYQFAENRH
jgi:hypothetical protein